MLDAYIIERIRREREGEREGTVIPLRIERPEPTPVRRDEAEPEPERGSIVIDFNL